MFQIRVTKELKRTFNVQYFSFSKIVPYMSQCAKKNQNAFLDSTTSLVTRTRHNVTLYVHCLSCYKIRL